MLQILILVTYFSQEGLKEAQKNEWWNFSTESNLERVEFSFRKTLHLGKAMKWGILETWPLVFTLTIMSIVTRENWFSLWRVV